MDVAVATPNVAEALLSANGISAEDSGYLVAKYSRLVRRLQLDVRQEYERKSLVLNHALEEEILERSEPSVLPVPVQSPSGLFSVIGNTASVTINLGPGAVAIGSNVRIEHVLAGGIEYSKEDRQILRLIESVPDDVGRLELRSELERMNDPATSPEEKRTAVQKLKTFLYTSALFVGKKAEEIGTQLLIKYLEMNLGTPPS